MSRLTTPQPGSSWAEIDMDKLIHKWVKYAEDFKKKNQLYAEELVQERHRIKGAALRLKNRKAVFVEEFYDDDPMVQLNKSCKKVEKWLNIGTIGDVPLVKTSTLDVDVATIDSDPLTLGEKMDNVQAEGCGMTKESYLKDSNAAQDTSEGTNAPQETIVKDSAILSKENPNLDTASEKKNLENVLAKKENAKSVTAENKNLDMDIGDTVKEDATLGIASSEKENSDLEIMFDAAEDSRKLVSLHTEITAKEADNRQEETCLTEEETLVKESTNPIKERSSFDENPHEELSDVGKSAEATKSDTEGDIEQILPKDEEEGITYQQTCPVEKCVFTVSASSTQDILEKFMIHVYQEHPDSLTSYGGMPTDPSTFVFLQPPKVRSLRRLKKIEKKQLWDMAGFEVDKLKCSHCNVEMTIDNFIKHMQSYKCIVNKSQCPFCGVLCRKKTTSDRSFRVYFHIFTVHKEAIKKLAVPPTKKRAHNRIPTNPLWSKIIRMKLNYEEKLRKAEKLEKINIKENVAKTKDKEKVNKTSAKKATKTNGTGKESKIIKPLMSMMKKTNQDSKSEKLAKKFAVINEEGKCEVLVDATDGQPSYSCSFCCQHYKNYCSFRRHIRHNHPAVVLFYQCILCKSKFNKHIGLTVHLRHCIHQSKKNENDFESSGPSTPDVQEIVYDRKLKRRISHYASVGQKKLSKKIKLDAVTVNSPEYIPKESSKEKSVLKNIVPSPSTKKAEVIISNISPRYSCRYCYKEFFTLGTFNLHLSPDHPDVVYICGNCKVSFNTQSLFFSHKSVCSKSSSNQPRSFIPKGKIYQCPYPNCSIYVPESFSQFKRHLILSHYCNKMRNEGEDNDEVYRCIIEECPVINYTCENMMTHFREHSTTLLKELMKDFDDVMAVEQKSFRQCPFPNCGITSTDLVELNQHALTHNPHFSQKVCDAPIGPLVWGILLHYLRCRYDILDRIVRVQCTLHCPVCRTATPQLCDIETHLVNHLTENKNDYMKSIMKIISVVR